MSSSLSSGSLYVGDLHPEVTETQLFDIFKQIGSVASIRVCRDAITRRSLGYAYVNYHTVSDAEHALEALNYQDVKGRPIRIMWSHRDPSLRKSGVGNLFIKNLDKTIDNKFLYDTFSPLGKILSLKVASDNGVSRGYGFIHFEKQEEADLAISQYNGKALKDKEIYVGPFIPRKNFPSSVIRFTNVYVKNLDPSIGETELTSLFEKFGKITRAAVMMAEGISRQFGFVNFSDPAEAQAAVAGMNDNEVKGKILYVGRAKKKIERENELRRLAEQRKIQIIRRYQGSNLYVKNLDDTIDDEKLRTEFSQFGTITSSKIMRDENKLSRGFGFVCYSSPEEATKAITDMNGRILVSKPIYVALAQRREDRRAQLEAKYLQSQSGHRLMGPPQSIFPPSGSPAVFYSGSPLTAPGPRQNYVYPQSMIPNPNRNRWTGGAPGQPQGGAPGSYQSGNFNANSQRPQRPNRQRNGPQPNISPSGGGRGANPGNRRNFKYTTNVRNHPQAQGIEHGVSSDAGVENIGPKVSISALAAGNPEENKMMLGETLYPLIAVQEPIHAAKITGMLLESLDLSELIHLVESTEDLSVKVSEARAVLEAHATPEGVSA